MEWFGIFNKDKSEEDVPNKEVVDGVLAGLNLKQALEAHQALKGQLQKVLDGESNETLDIAIVSQDVHCYLGKWIYGNGKKYYGHMPGFEDVRSAHEDFHVCAGEVLTSHQAGHLQEAEALFKTKFRSISNKNQMLLTDFFRVVKAR